MTCVMLVFSVGKRKGGGRWSTACSLSQSGEHSRIPRFSHVEVHSLKTQRALKVDTFCRACLPDELTYHKSRDGWSIWKVWKQAKSLVLELSSERSALQRAPPGNGDPLSDPAESDAGPTAPSSRTEWEVGTLEGLGFALALAPGPVVSDKEDEKDSRPCQIQFQFMSVVGWYLPLSVCRSMNYS